MPNNGLETKQDQYLFNEKSTKNMYEAKVASIGHMLWNKYNLCKLTNMSYISYIFYKTKRWISICVIVFHPFDLHKIIPSDILCVLDSNVHFILKRTFWASSHKKQKLVSINAIVLNVLKSQLFTHRIHTFTHTHAHSFLPNFSPIKNPSQ